MRKSQPRRIWVSWYNRHGEAFDADNGIRWFRVSIRWPLFGWRQLGGLWWQVFPRRRFKVLLPERGGPRAPIEATQYPGDEAQFEFERSHGWL